MRSQPSFHTGSKILVACGGPFDRNVLNALGFTDVTISNLDERISASGENPFLPYAWSHQDLETLNFKDKSFDVVIVHSGLHHLRCPQRGINEMYRVARIGILGFEPNRNFYTALGVQLGVGQKYEDAAVYYNSCRWGGVANTDVPNYVVRFNKGDVQRIIQTYCPVADHKIECFYATRVSPRVNAQRSKGLTSTLVTMLSGLITILGKLPCFANNMAFWVPKPVLPADLFPWLEMKGATVGCNASWLETKYKENAI